MSKREEKPEPKSPPKTKIKKGSGELTDEHLDKVTGGITLQHEGAPRTK